MKARDQRKDQTYFLCYLSQDILRRTLFPLGDYLKDEIRLVARDHQIEAVDRPESQDLCFLDGTDYRSFIAERRPENLVPGEIVDVQGNHLGSHSGLANYTIGQRKGLGISSSEPLYVIRKEIPTNRLVVGRLADLGTKSFIANLSNWISGEIPRASFDAQVKIRYQSRPVEATITMINPGSFIVQSETIFRDVTPGQFSVLYDQDQLIGGGVISSSTTNYPL
jgi:tRNA-specific 2-thiouridylase